MFSATTLMAGGNHDFKIETSKSKVEWVGKKVTGQHNGDIKIKSGNLVVDGTTIKSGSFTIDMTSINTTDIDGEMKQNLDGHLKSKDFFNTAEHNTAMFEITSVEDKKEGVFTHVIKGNLTIKGITKEISFPAKIGIQGHAIAAYAKFNVNRTDFDIKYGSGSFFEGLGDKAINDEFELQINLAGIAKH